VAKQTTEDVIRDLRAQATAAFPPDPGTPAAGPPNYGTDGRIGYLLKLSQAVENRVQYETGWIGQRMTWLVVSQSFLFGAFATASAQTQNELLIFLKWLIASVALVQVTFAYLAIRAAKCVGADLLRLRSVIDAGIQQQPGLDAWPILGLVRSGMSRGSIWQGSSASHVIPISLLLSWIAVLGALVFRWWVFGER
jgi:hypothetical protein